MSAKRGVSDGHTLEYSKRLAGEIINLDILERQLNDAKKNEVGFLKEFNRRQRELDDFKNGKPFDAVMKAVQDQRDNLINLNRVENTSQDKNKPQIDLAKLRISSREEQIESAKARISLKTEQIKKIQLNILGETQKIQSLESLQIYDTQIVTRLELETKQSTERGLANYISIKELEGRMTHYTQLQIESNEITANLKVVGQVIKNFEEQIRNAKGGSLTNTLHPHFGGPPSDLHKSLGSWWGGSQLAPHNHLLTGGLSSGGGGSHLPAMMYSAAQPNAGKEGHVSSPDLDLNYDDLFQTPPEDREAADFLQNLRDRGGSLS